METTKTIKGIEVIAYKGMKSDMTCKGFQYEVGKSYKTDKAELCNCGFHACLNPRDVLDYYSQSIKSRYFKVKLSGEITKCDFENTKVAATEITILEEITDTFNEIINTTEWWKTENVLDFLYFSDGFTIIRNCERQYNFIDKKGKLLSEKWFNRVTDFRDGLAKVQRSDKKYNFINKNGNYLSDEWFKWSGDFHNGFAGVQRANGDWNFIDKEGNYLSEQVFKRVDDFHDGFARVQRGNSEYNFIDKQGKFISKEWFICVDNFNDGFAIVKRGDGLWNFIDKNGKILSEQWFNDVYYFHTDFAKVQRSDKKYNFINKKGKFLSDEWFIDACYLDDGLTVVKRANGDWCQIDKTGTLIKFKDMETTNTIKGIEVIAYKGMEFDMTCRDLKYEVGKTYKTDKVKLCEIGFHACLNPLNILYPRYASSRYFKVKLSGEITKCDNLDTKVAATEITILEEITIKELRNITEWWKNENVLDLLYFSDGFARVQRGDGLWNFVDKKGKILSDEWFNFVDNFHDGFAKVQRKEDKQYNFIDKNGKLLSNEWFIEAYYLDNGLAIVQKANDEWFYIDKTGTLIKFKDMEEKIKQVEDIDTLKELNKNLISENERLAKKNMKLSEKYQSTHKKKASLRTAIASIKGFENAEQLCAELNRLKQQNKSLSEANAKLIADAKVYLKTIDEQKKVISASEKSIGTINDKLKIITLSQQSMHQALKDSGDEKSELVKKYKEALSEKSVAQARQEELEKENRQLKEENIQLRENMINVYYKASLIQRIKYVFTKSI